MNTSLKAYRCQDTNLLMMDIPTPLANSSSTDSCQTACPSNSKKHNLYKYYGYKSMTALALERLFAMQPVASWKFRRRSQVIMISWSGYTFRPSECLPIAGFSDNL